MLTKPLLSALACLTLAGCSLTGGEESNTPQTNQTNKARLGTMQFTPVALNHDPVPAKTLARLREDYTRLHSLVNESDVRQRVEYRLAELEILLAEQQQEQGQAVASEGYYGNAIDHFERLLNQYPDQPQNAEVLYQLAKAYDLQGQAEQSFTVLDRLKAEYPDNPYLAEAHFRQGEIHYGRGEYPKAIGAYKAVLAQGEDNPYFVTAAYMLGWSYFKIEQQDSALRAFTQLLDHSLPNDIINPEALANLDSHSQLAEMPVGQRRLITDTIRIMALVLSYQGAEQGLIAHFDQVGDRHYEHLLYDQLGQQFLNDDRYRDSANVFHAFTEQHPSHQQAPFFAVKAIDAYILGDFPTLVLPAKRDFVIRYGIHGPGWGTWGQLLQDQVKPFLHDYLQELAQFEHSTAQLLNKASSDSEAEDTALEQADKASKAYEKAAGYYREFIQTFPQDQQTPVMTFNLAESLYESEDFAGALEAYEIYAYQYLDEPNAAEAGYAAILSYSALLETALAPAQQTQWRERLLVSQGQFVNRFATDERAVDVLHTRTQTLFTLERYEQAWQSAKALLAWQPAIDAQRQLANQLVVAHSVFALQHYALAEANYENVLALMPQDDIRRADMTERLAASIYRQAEQNLQADDKLAAVNDFLRVLAKTPNASIRLTAQYDAANTLLALQDWQQAANLFEDFRTRFARHALTASIGDKLIFAYQQNEQWLPAADELTQVWQHNPQSEQGRQALYVAAQYYLKAGHTQRSLESYRSYAHAYPTPFDEATEARHQMSQFYLDSGEQGKRRFWLRKLIQADAAAGQARTDRSRYLAAMSSLVFADDTLPAFERIKLTLPLKTSLKKKRQALETALEMYNKTLGYQVAEFSTAAQYRIADIYAQLARDLMDSQRPKGLNALELEQYDILLEEQAYPFEEQAIEIHENNVKLSWQGTYDKWVKQSFTSLSSLLPGRYRKAELISEVTDEIQ